MKEKKVWAAIALTMMATTTLTGCRNDDTVEDQRFVVCPVEPPTLELTRAEQEMVNQANEFAFNLFRSAQDPQQSQVLSPISITYALGMLNNGAYGRTQTQINQVLGFGESGADGINDFCYKLSKAAPDLDPTTKVMTANTIYVNKPYELKPEFVAKAKTFYGAEPETRDFYDGQTRDVINQWAADHTEQMVKEVLTVRQFNPDAVSYLLNATYFKGIWKKKFDKAMTADAPFTGTSGQPTVLPMMHQSGTFDYGETDDYQALRLPYGNETWQMTLLLPKQHSGAVPQVPTAEVWQQLSQQMYGQEVNVWLPRFETDTDIDLIPVMNALGMTDAFINGVADFRNFCDVSTFIGLMKQVAKIKLDEEGTEAAAVTVIGLDKAIAAEPYVVAFRADHPFLYVISEQQTGAIFFIGQFTGQ